MVQGNYSKFKTDNQTCKYKKQWAQVAVAKKPSTDISLDFIHLIS